ncbi:hypothetical protein VNO80_08816 [Phaseolus coccineus]|uniref:Uncharacterized protein n=1 Tax=Phaseolus coccineus TaxID=3886 RepID=A0AAN9NAA4_PHACN
MGQCVWTDSPLAYNLKGSCALGCVMCGHCSETLQFRRPSFTFRNPSYFQTNFSLTALFIPSWAGLGWAGLANSKKLIPPLNDVLFVSPLLPESLHRFYDKGNGLVHYFYSLRIRIWERYREFAERGDRRK